MDRRLLGVLAALPLLLAGCVMPGTTVDAAGAVPDLSPVEAALWDDKQNAPHPAFGWPTLSRPATGAGVSEWWTPIVPAELPDPIAGMEHLAQTEDVTVGAGIALFGSLAVVPMLGQGSSVLDIRDPSAPKVLSTVETEDGAHRGAAILAYPDGRLVFIVATPSTVAAYDVTDPTKPVKLPNLPIERSHKVGVVPGTPIVYNANSRGAAGASILDANTGKGNGVIEIVDMTDPANPVLVQEFKNGYGCHHIYFWQTAEKQRAICAGIQFTQILDIADPRAPVIVSSIPVHHGDPGLPSTSVSPVFFSHFSILNDDGTVLIVGDETGGGAAAACDGPGYAGNLWFYDVKDETDPKLMGWFDPGPYFAENPPMPQPSTNPAGMIFGSLAGCTAHHGRLVPDAANDGARDLLAMAFYGAGVVLVDFTDPAKPKMVDQFAKGTNTWEVWYYNGYLFTGDMRRGLDVLTFA